MKRNCFPLVVFCSVILLLPILVNAQLGKVKRPKITLGGSVVYSMPQGAFKDAYNYGLGAEVFGGVGLGSTYVIATVGLSGYKAQPGNTAGTLTAVPVKAGFKKYFLLKKLFINADAGVSSVKINNNNSGAFTAGFGAGVRLLGLEAALYYNAFKKQEGNGYDNSLNVKIGWSVML